MVELLIAEVFSEVSSDKICGCAINADFNSLFLVAKGGKKKT